MLRALKIEPDKCTGCLHCELACSYKNEGVFNPAKSRIRVFTFHDTGRYTPYTCTQCDEAWCLHACPVEAIVLNLDTGAKDVRASACVGCKVCTIACPYGTVNFDLDRGIVSKCDLCAGDPWCVKACPTHCITYVDVDHTGRDQTRARVGAGSN
jgi:Fe-S-cluster-containing hydrogenase component 2